MPSSKNYKRDYKQEAKYHATEEQKTNRAKRNKARRMMEREVGKDAIRGKDVDHSKPLAKGGGNSRNNLSVKSKSSNRSFKRTKTAGMK